MELEKEIKSLYEAVRDRLEEYNKQQIKEGKERMIENLKIILDFWKDETSKKLHAIAIEIYQIITTKGGKKIGRTCNSKKERLEYYQLAGENYVDLIFINEEIKSVKLIEALESFCIDFFLFECNMKLDNADGKKRGPTTCQDSTTHHLYVAVDKLN